MASASGPIGPCPHGVVDDICRICTVDNHWRDVVSAIPSKHLVGDDRETSFGYRRYLGLLALEAALLGKRITYLEVGVRLGHSLALVTWLADTALEAALGIDAFVPEYGGEPNPGAVSVFRSLDELGIPTDRIEIWTGDSASLLPCVLDPFDLVLIDGDHTPDGARRDLEEGLRVLAPGGVLVFDDTDFDGDTSLREVFVEIQQNWTAYELASAAIIPRDGNYPGWAWMMRAEAPRVEIYGPEDLPRGLR